MISIPNDPKDRQRVKEAVNEISLALGRIQSEREHINDILEVLQDEFGLPKKYMRKVAKIYHLNAMNEIQTENSDIEDLYNSITA